MLRSLLLWVIRFRLTNSPLVLRLKKLDRSNLLAFNKFFDVFGLLELVQIWIALLVSSPLTILVLLATFINISKFYDKLTVVSIRVSRTAAILRSFLLSWDVKIRLKQIDSFITNISNFIILKRIYCHLQIVWWVGWIYSKYKVSGPAILLKP